MDEDRAKGKMISTGMQVGGRKAAWRKKKKET